VLELFRGIRIGLRAGVDHAMSIQLWREGNNIPAPAETGLYRTPSRGAGRSSDGRARAGLRGCLRQRGTWSGKRP
jgi:hypothetical protein